MLFAGMVSPVMCPDYKPTEGRHKKTKLKTTHEQGRDRPKKQFEQSYACAAGEPRATQETQKRAKTKG